MDSWPGLSSDLVPGPWGSAFDGYCIGLCAQWTAMQYQGTHFPVAGDKTCDNPPWQSTQLSVVWNDCAWVALPNADPPTPTM